MDWIQKELAVISVERPLLSPQSIVLIADVTFFGRGYGILVFRSPSLKKNIYWEEVKNENPDIYRQARKEIEQPGFIIQGMVLDGRKGVREVFSDIPVQMCHFRQRAILKRYLTSKPKLEAGQELRVIGGTLTFLKETEFTQLLDQWHEKWESFLKERTFDPDGKHWHYTHTRIRSAYRSLKDNLLFLFTHQRHPRLNIPNTTNSLDGFFGQMKTLLRVHRGLSKERRYKVIQEILRK
jgi:hypothetical protein